MRKNRKLVIDLNNIDIKKLRLLNKYQTKIKGDMILVTVPKEDYKEIIEKLGENITK